MNVIDRRRRLGPSTAIPLKFPSVDETPDSKQDSTNNESQERLFIKLSNIPTATGSSYIQSGNNILLASVYGPRPSFKRTFNNKAVLKITFQSSPFLSTSNSEYNNNNSNNNNNNNKTNDINIDPEYNIVNSVILSTLETACSNLILLDQYPKSTIDIFINLINTDSSTKFIELLSLIHNAVNLALIDSGMSIKNFPSSVVNNGIFINSIHSDTYTDKENEDLENEELLTFYIPKSSNTDNNLFDVNFQNSLSDTIKKSRELRAELSQFCFSSL